jgi:hypothetical protein
LLQVLSFLPRGVQLAGEILDLGVQVVKVSLQGQLFFGHVIRVALESFQVALSGASAADQKSQDGKLE